MRTRYIFISIAILAVLGLMIAGCGKQAHPVDSESEVSALSTPNADGYAGNSHIQYLGKVVDPETGRELDGFKIVDYRPGYVPERTVSAKPPWAGGGGGGGGESTCFAFIANGFKWRTVEGWELDTTNSPFPAADDATVLSILDASVDRWEAEAGTGILGDGVINNSQANSEPTYDGKNVVYFGSYSDPNVIAVTYTWGVWYGSPKNREIYEFDQLYNIGDFAWSLNGAAGMMDFDNIATHELGHACGLDHPDSTCTEETMYAYASISETKKRSLEAGDIAGISDLY